MQVHATCDGLIDLARRTPSHCVIVSVQSMREELRFGAGEQTVDARECDAIVSCHSRCALLAMCLLYLVVREQSRF